MRASGHNFGVRAARFLFGLFPTDFRSLPIRFFAVLAECVRGVSSRFGNSGKGSGRFGRGGVPGAAEGLGTACFCRFWGGIWGFRWIWAAGCLRARWLLFWGAAVCGSGTRRGRRRRARLSGRVRRGGRRLRCRKWNLPGVRRKTLWRSGGRRWSVLSGSRPGCGRRYGRRNAIMRRCVCGTALLCLCLCAACSRRVEVPVPLLLRTEVPAHLLEATPEPIFQGTSNGDLLEWALENRDALRRCNADKRAIERAGER